MFCWIFLLIIHSNTSANPAFEYFTWVLDWVLKGVDLDGVGKCVSFLLPCLGCLQELGADLGAQPYLSGDAQPYPSIPRPVSEERDLTLLAIKLDSTPKFLWNTSERRPGIDTTGGGKVQLNNMAALLDLLAAPRLDEFLNSGCPECIADTTPVTVLQSQDDGTFGNLASGVLRPGCWPCQHLTASTMLSSCISSEREMPQCLPAPAKAHALWPWCEAVVALQDLTMVNSRQLFRRHGRVRTHPFQSSSGEDLERRDRAHFAFPARSLWLEVRSPLRPIGHVRESFARSLEQVFGSAVPPRTILVEDRVWGRRQNQGFAATCNWRQYYLRLRPLTSGTAEAHSVGPSGFTSAGWYAPLFRRTPARLYTP